MGEASDRIVALSIDDTVGSYSRRLKSGKTVQVRAHSRARKEAAEYYKNSPIEELHQEIARISAKARTASNDSLLKLLLKVLRTRTIPKVGVSSMVNLSAAPAEVESKPTVSPAAEALKEKTAPENPDRKAVAGLREKLDPDPAPVQGDVAPDIDDVIAKYDMTGKDPYEEYENTMRVANELDMSWLEARDHILAHGQDMDRSGYGRAAVASRVLQVQQGMDPKSAEFAEALLKTTQHGYYETTPSDRKAWAEKVAAEGIDPLKWIRENLKSGSESPVKNFIKKTEKSDG